MIKDNQAFGKVVYPPLTEKVYHCGLDDTIVVLEEINQKADQLDSIFDVEVLGIIRQFHQQYGAKFTLYVFYELLDGFNLSQMTDRFADEWQANSDWLKLSFHAKTRKPSLVDYYLYFDSDYETAFEDFQMIKKEILRFAGPQCWDNYPRTHFASGNRETVRAWRDCGVGGLFYGTHEDEAMYFDIEKIKELREKDCWYDSSADMLYITTNIKLPCHTVDEVKVDLAAAKDRNILEIFADDYNIVELKEHMETAISWASQNGYRPVFHEEVFDNVAVI